MSQPDEFRPGSLSHLVGQDHVRQVVGTALDYAFQEQVPFPHALALGPPGLGKTAIARVIATELASTFHEVLGSAITSPAEFYSVLLKLKDLDVAFIDELHTLDVAHQHALLIALDERKVYLPSGGGSGAPQAIKLADFTLIGATTDEHAVIKPLVDRFKLLLRFSHYSVPELAEIVRTRAKGLGWAIDDEVTEPIGARSKGVPRLAIRLLQSCWRVCRAVGHDRITMEHLRRACELEQIDSLGLDAVETAYLRCLIDSPQRLNMLASYLGLPARTISTSTETFLIRAGLITKDRNGLRMLTPKGIDHVGKASES